VSRHNPDSFQQLAYTNQLAAKHAIADRGWRLSAQDWASIDAAQHLSLAFEEAFRVGEKPVTVEVIEAVLSRQIDDLEPKLMRHGYDVRILASQFNVKPAEFRQFLQGALDADRARDLTGQMLAAGLPL
jgi:hypothetical protein